MTGRVSGRRIVGALVAVAAIALAPAAAAQSVVAPALDGDAIRARLAPLATGKPLPADASALDAMVARKDWTSLSKRLHGTSAPQAVGLDLNWERQQLFDGAGFLLAYAYMDGLWRSGSAVGDDGLKQSAAMMFVYAFTLIRLDGARCGDASAPSHRRDQLIGQNQPIIAYLRTLPRAQRMTLGTIALAWEAATAPLRRDDDVLCSGGMDEISAGLKAADQTPLKQVPNAPGTFGKTYVVPPAPGYAPRFVAPEVWRPLQAETRRSLPDALTRLLTMPGDAPAPVPPAG